MKRTILVLPSFLCVFVLQANTYYSTNNSAPNTLSNWHTNRNGTGTSPWNFSSGDIFVVQSGHSLTTTANWTVSGTNAAVIIETGATLLANNKITVPSFEIDGTGTYVHNGATNVFPGSTTRTLAATSTVEIRNWSGSAALPNPTTWGNLIINVAGYSSSMNQAGNLTDIAGDLDIRNTGTGSNEFRLATNQNYTLTIGGDLIIEGGVLEAGQNNGNHTQVIIIDGSYTQSGGTFTRSNNNANTLQVQLNGSGSNFTLTGGTLTGTYMDWTVNASKKLKLNNNLPIASSRSLTVNGTLDCGTSQVTGAGSFTLASTGSVITSNTLGVGGSIGVTGPTVFNSNGSYEFHGATTTPFPTSGGTVSASNILIDADVTINKDVTISGTLNMSSGRLTIPAGNTITISSGNAIGGSDFGVSKQIVTQVNTSTGAKGMLRMSNFSGSTTLPIGNGTYYMPVTLTVPGVNDFSVAVFQGATKNGAPNGTALTTQQKTKMIDAVWIINRNGGTDAASMQLSWPSALEGSLFQSLADNQIGIAHNSGYWESPLGSGSQSQNTVSRTNVTNFSPFGIGQIGTPLPLKFGDIKVSEKNNNVISIDWTSYNEINLSHFEIERSQNGQQFMSVGRVNAKNNDSKADYSWTDTAPLRNISFYRVNGVDIDGKSNYSTVVKVDLGQASSEFTLFPNPVQDKRISIQAGNMDRGEYKLNISNLYGRMVYTQTLIHAGGIISQVIALPSDTPPGVYSISLSGNGAKLLKQFVVK